jgi:uncharacterized protein involved in exopolysaccharide biosynthesis
MEDIEKNNTDEIDLVEVFKKIWAGRKTIYKTVVIFFVLGLIIALGTPNEYKSEVTLLVENESKSGGMSGLLQQVSGLAGLNMGSMSGTTDALGPKLYPDVIKSAPFLLEIMDQKVTESKYDSTITVSQYLDHHTRSSILGLTMDYTIGLPGKIMRWLRGDQKLKIIGKKSETRPLQLTQKQSEIAKSLSECIRTKEGEFDNTLIISVEMQDPLVAAQLTDSVVKCLSRYVIDYRTQKAKNDLEFIAKRTAEAEAKYVQSQRALAAHRDQNKNVISAYAKTEEDRLQAEYTLAFNVFNTLSQQLEQAKIKVQQETPVFKILDPAQQPLHNSKPKTFLILLAMLFFGAFVGIGFIFLKFNRK